MMRKPCKLQPHKYAATVLLLAILFGAATCAMWFTGTDVLDEVLNYTPWKLWNTPFHLRDEVESTIRYNLPYRMEIRDTYSATLVARGSRATDTFYIVKDNKGYLLQTNLYQEIDPDVTEYARRLRLLQDATEDAGSRMLFVGAGGKYIPGVNQLPAGYPRDNASLRNLDELFLRLLAYQVENVDLREDFKAASLPYGEYYYRTDSGWTAQAALFAAGEIVREAGERLGMEWNGGAVLKNPSNFEVVRYPKIFQGDYGRLTGVPFGGLDDYQVVTPVFETDLTFEVPGRDIVRHGTFSQAVLDTRYLSVTDPRYDSPEATFFGSGLSRVHLVNHDLPEGKKVLFICDTSFFSVAGYLALACAEVDVLRANQYPAGHIEEMAASGRYDLVIVACQAQSIGAQMFPFHTS